MAQNNPTAVAWCYPVLWGNSQIKLLYIICFPRVIRWCALMCSQRRSLLDGMLGRGAKHFWTTYACRRLQLSLMLEAACLLKRSCKLCHFQKQTCDGTIQGWRAHCLSHNLHHFQLFTPSPVKFPIVKKQLLTPLRSTASMSATYSCPNARYIDLHRPEDSPAPRVPCELALVSGTAQERAAHHN